MPAACLAAAAAWRAGTVVRDARWVRRCDAGQRVYRTGLGWTSTAQQASRRRWAFAGLASAVLLLTATLLARTGALAVKPASLLSGAACLVVLLWLLRDRMLHHGRYTSVCIATLAAIVLVGEVATLTLRPPAAAVTGLHAAGVLASFFASQLYLVAGIRKLRAPHFMTGRVLADTLAFGLFQAAAGNREFVKLVRAERLPALLRSPRFLLGCRIAAALTVGAELGLGLGALGLLPVGATLALAVVTHSAFTLISPRRLFPFSAAAIGLLGLALVHPIAALGA